MNVPLLLSRLSPQPYCLAALLPRKTTALLVFLLLAYTLPAQIYFSRKSLDKHDFSFLKPTDGIEVTKKVPGVIYSCCLQDDYSSEACIMGQYVYRYTKAPHQTERQFIDNSISHLPKGAEFFGNLLERKLTEYKDEYRTAVYKYQETSTYMFIYFRRNDVVIVEYSCHDDNVAAFNASMIDAGAKFAWTSQYTDVPALGINFCLPTFLEVTYQEADKKANFTIAADELAAETEGQITMTVVNTPSRLDTAQLRKAVADEVAGKSLFGLSSPTVGKVQFDQNRIVSTKRQETIDGKAYDINVFTIYMLNRIVTLTCRCRSGSFERLQGACSTITGSVKPIQP